MEVVWRTLLSVFLASMLLIGGVSNQQTTCTPTASAEDIGRATVAASGVFEGRLEMLGGPPAFNATFSFRRSYKGKFRRMSRAAARPEVVVRFGSTGNTRLSTTDSRAGCSVSELLQLQQDYLVFVGQSVRTEDAEGQSGTVSFQSAAFPVPLTTDTVRLVRAYQCRKCGQWLTIWSALLYLVLFY